MISVFVHSSDQKGAPLIADHFEFEVVPRAVEEIGLDQDGRSFHLEVVGVMHHAKSKAGYAASASNVELSCRLVK
jgi:hypothetical protein